MKIIINHTLRSIKANIGQPILIVFTVAIVTMLFFASLVLGDLFYNFQYANLSRLSGKTDVSVSGGILSEEKLKKYEKEHTEEIEYSDKYLSMAGLLETADSTESVAVLIEATDLTQYIERYKSKLVIDSQIGEEKYVFPEIFIGKNLSEKFGYKVGEEIEIYVGLLGRKQTFTVTHIFENKGFFANSTIYNILTDVSSFGNKGLYTEAYYKLKTGTEKEKFIESLTDYLKNPDVTVSDAVDFDYIERLVSDNENLLKVAIIFVISLVSFILFGAYSVVAKNRTDELLVFKASGATPNRLFFILLTEVLLYGAIGGGIGLIFGRCGMEIVAHEVIPGFTDAILYRVWHYFVAFFAGIAMSVLGSILPIVKLVKNTVKKQSSKQERTAKKVNPFLIFVPTIGIIGGIIGVLYIEKSSILFTIITIVSSAVFILFSTPYVFGAVCRLFGFGKGIAKLSAVSLKRNAEAVSICGIIAVVMAFSFVTVSIVNIIIEASEPTNARFEADYVIQSISGKESVINANEAIKSISGIEKSALYDCEKFDYDFNERNTDLYLYSVKDADSLDFVCELTEKEKEAFNNIDNSAVVSYDVLARMKKKVGDKLTFTFYDKEYTFYVVSETSTRTRNDRVLFVNQKGIDFSLTENMIFINVKNNVPRGDFYNYLKAKIAPSRSFVIGFNDWANATNVGVDGIARLLRILQAVVALVGVAGVLNMTIAMSISRKKELDIYASVGLDQRKYLKMLVFEGLEMGITGSITGLFVGIATNFLVPSFARMIDRYISISVPWALLIIAGITIGLYLSIYLMSGYSNFARINQIRRKEIQTY